MVSLVPEDRVASFLDAVRARYYAPHADRVPTAAPVWANAVQMEKLAVSLFVTQAGDGAAVIIV